MVIFIISVACIHILFHWFISQEFLTKPKPDFENHFGLVIIGIHDRRINHIRWHKIERWSSIRFFKSEVSFGSCFRQLNFDIQISIPICSMFRLVSFWRKIFSPPLYFTEAVSVGKDILQKFRWKFSTADATGIISFSLSLGVWWSVPKQNLLLRMHDAVGTRKHKKNPSDIYWQQMRVFFKKLIFIKRIPSRLCFTNTKRLIKNRVPVFIFTKKTWQPKIVSPII